MTGPVLVRGLGSIGRRHTGVFRSLGYDVVGWPVRPRTDDPDGLRLVDDAEALALAARAELVVVATDTACHVPDALAVLAAGASRVLIEKPLAPTAADAAALLAVDGVHDRVVVAAPLRAHLGLRAFHEAVGALDRPRHASVFSQSWLPDWRPGRDYRESYSARADEGGALRDLVHEIDYAAVLLGPPRSVTAVLEREGPLEMAAEQGATLLWATDDGTVTVRVDYVTRPTRRGALVTSPSGSVAWDPLTATLTVTGPGGDAEVTTTPADLDRDAMMARQARAALALSPSAPLAERLAAGAPATLAEAVLAVEICDDARSCPSGGPDQP